MKKLSCGFYCCDIAVMLDLVCEVDCGNRDGKLVCGRQVLELTAFNLALYWVYVLVLSAIYGAVASLQFDGLGYG